MPTLVQMLDRSFAFTKREPPLPTEAAHSYPRNFALVAPLAQFLRGLLESCVFQALN
jgi:hypothetical protein